MGDHVSKRLRLASDADMEERYFQNPYPDWDQRGPAAAAASGPEPDCNRTFDEDGKVSAAFQRKVQDKIRDLVLQMEEGLRTADPHDGSAYTGWAGVALLYLQLHRLSRDSAHLQRALDHVRRATRTLSGRRVSFLCGDAGPLAVGAAVHHRLGNAADSRDCLSRCVAAARHAGTAPAPTVRGGLRRLLRLRRAALSPDGELPDELLYGRAGYLYALLYVRRELGPQAVDAAAVSEVVASILESGRSLSAAQRKAERCPLLYEWHGKPYLGAAHGLAGIYYMLMQPGAGLHPEQLAEAVRPSVDYVRHKRLRSGNFPSSLSNDSDRLVHWCHGAPGVVHMLLMAHQVFGDDRYLKEACDGAEVVWQRGLLRKGYGICHGTAGNGYVFLSLYKRTRDPKHLYRACKFAEWCLDYGTHGCRIPDRPYSLFEGMAGTIHYLSEMADPEASSFPAFEL